MQTSDRSNASRTNGAKSHGPTTEAGKQRSSMNAIRHGLLSKYVVLQNESQEQFEAVFDDHLITLAPANNVELICVEEMAAAAWRIRRLMAIETSIMDKAIAKRTEEDELSRTSAAFSQLAAGQELHLIDRYGNRLQRTYQRAFNNLQLLKQLHKPSALPDPEPIPEPTPAPVDGTPPTPKKPQEPNEPGSPPPPPESAIPPSNPDPSPHKTPNPNS